MSLYQFLYDENPVLSIELSILTWSTLLWNSIKSRADLLALQARQLKHRKEDVKETTLYLRYKKKKNKELFNEKHQTNSSFNTDDLILLHNTKLNNCYNRKLAPQWFEFYQIKEAIIIKNIYLLEELNNVSFNDTAPGNQIKCFYHQNFNLNPASYTEEAAFPSSASLIKGELTVPSDLSLPDLVTPSAWGFIVYEFCTQPFYHQTEVMSLLLHNAAVSELSHYRIEVMMPSSDSEASIDIIYDEWSVIIHFVSLKGCAHCDPEPAVVSLISQALNNT